MAISDSVTFFAKSVTWNSNTYSNTVSGLVTVEYTVADTNTEFSSGLDMYSTLNATVNRAVTARVIVSDYAPTDSGDIGVSSSLVATVTEADRAGERVVTMTGMKLVGVSGRQSRGSASETVLDFVHVSSDGTTYPISVA